MPKKLEQPTRKVTHLLFDEDIQYLEEVYKKVGVAPVVRQLVHNHVRKLKERAARTESLHDQTSVSNLADDIKLEVRSDADSA